MAAPRIFKVLFTGDAESLKKASQESSDAIDGVAKKTDSTSASFASFGKGAAIIGAATVGAAAVAGAALFKFGSDWDDAYDAIQIGTGASGEALEGLKDTFKAVFSSVPTDMQSASLAIADLNTKLGLSGPALQDVATVALNLSRITGVDVATAIDKVSKLTNNWNLEASSAGLVMDKLYIAAQSTGVGVDVLAEGVTKFGPILRSMGLSMDQSIAVMGSLSKAGVDGELVFKGLQRAVIAAADAGKPANVAISDLFDSIKNAKDPTERLNLAVEAFGSKAGPQMADALASGKFSVEELTAMIEGSADAVNNAAEDTADAAEKWQEFKNKLMTALEPASAAVFNFAGQMADKLGPALETVARVLREDVQPRLESFAKWAKDNEPVIVPILVGIAGAIGVGLVGALAVAIPLVWAKAAAWTAAAAAMLIANAPLILIALAVGALTAGVFLLIRHWDEITAKFPILGEIADRVKAALAVVVEWIKTDLVPTVLRIGEAIAEAVGKAVSFVSEQWPKVQAAIAPVVAWLTGTVLPDLRAAFEAIIGWITGTLIPAVTKIAEAVMRGIGGALEWVRENWPKIREWVQPVLDFIALYVSTTWEAIKLYFSTAFGVLKGLWEIFAGAFSGDWDRVWGGVKQIVFSLWDGIKGAFELGLSFLRGLIPIVGDIAGKIGLALLSALEAAAKGAANAVIGAVEWMINRVLDGLATVVQKIKSATDALPGGNPFGDQLQSAINLLQNGVSLPRLASGLWEVPGMRGAGDIYPAMLSPGEMVVPAATADRLRSRGMSSTGAPSLEVHVHGDVYARSDGEARQSAGALGYGVWAALRARGVA